MAKDLRTYLKELADAGQIKVVEREVDPVFEATAIVDKMEDDPSYPGFPAVLFKTIKGSAIPLLINTHGTYGRLALAIGTDVRGMVDEFATREGNFTEPEWVSRAQSPVKEVVWTGDQIDLSRLLNKHMTY